MAQASAKIVLELLLKEGRLIHAYEAVLRESVERALLFLPSSNP